jgi:ketosteroid isomerase-like protein
MQAKSWILGLLIFVVCIVTSNAQQISDIDAIKAVNDVFYAALSARDLKTMETVWAKKPYTIVIGPRSKDMSVGSEAVKKYWQETFELFSKVSVSSSITQGQADGKLAWIIGTEAVQLQPKRGGQALKFETFVTHVFEKEGEHWLLVSHQSQVVGK